MNNNKVYLHLEKEDPYFTYFNGYTFARSSPKPDVEGLVARLHHRVSYDIIAYPLFYP